MPKPRKPVTPKKPVGRPRALYTATVGDAICDHLANGKSLTSWCELPGSVSYSTVLKWLRESESFAMNYVRAREAQADFLAEEILTIANTPVIGVKTKINDKGESEIPRAT